MARNISTSGREVITLKQTRQTDKGFQCVAKGFSGASVTPTSPIIVDQVGNDLADMQIEHLGASKLEFWRSINSSDPVNFDTDLGKVPDGETPDHSNLKWRYIATLILGEEGTTEIPDDVLKVLSKSRYAKIEKVRGVEITLLHAYAV